MANRVELIFEALNRTNKAFTEIAADTKRTASAVESMAARGGAGMKSMETRAHGAAAGVAGIGGGASIAIGKVLLLEMAVNKIAQVLNRLVFSFNATLETANLGMSASFISAGQYIDEASGKALQGQQALAAAQGDAKAMTEELQVANFQTIATLDQLIRAYQETLPVAMARGFDRKQVKEFTVAMVQAAGAIGVSLDMLGEETRSMLTGAINPRTSRIATVLGLTNEDVAVYKGNAAGLYSFLMEKLSAYQAAGVQSQQTWAGVWSNTLDLFNQLSAKVSEPLFETIKAELQDITGEIVKINTETGKIEWNPEFSQGITDTKEGVAAVISEFYRLGMLIDKVGGSLTALGTVITFGEWDTQMREWNKMFQNNYAESDQKLLELANRLAGLNSDGSSKAPPAKTTYQPNPPPVDPDTITAQQKLADEWKKTSAKLTLDIDKSGLSAFDAKILEITAHATELRAKFGDKAEITAWETDQKGVAALKQEMDLLDLSIASLGKNTEDALSVFSGFALTLESTGGPMARITDGLRLYDAETANAINGTKALSQEGSAAFREMENAVDGWASSFSSQLNEVFWSADVTFKDILTSFAKMLSQMVIQKQIVEPLLGGAMSFLGGLGGSTAASTPSTFAANPASFNLGTPKFHVGGMFVPKFHFGGLNSDEGMAILKGGERVLTGEQNRTFDKLAAMLDGSKSSGSGSAEIHIHEAPGTKVSSERRSGPDGRAIIDLIITTTQDALGRGAFDNSLGQNFGLTRRGR